ncbi:MAG: sulfur carrier protein ThiS [Euryarchaeota archaeon]|nr:sulfur carrier protein ThiS [Euryarchaeota archaeon]
MSIDVNGNEMPYVKGETVSELLGRMNYVFPMLVVAIDGRIVTEAEFDTAKFRDGAKIEVIHLTSGG